jgi:hypothetical protein
VTTYPVTIPSAPLEQGVPLPPLCIRHGRPAVATRPATFTSRVPVWVYLLFLVSLLIAVVVAMVITKKVRAVAVPVCDQCLDDRRLRLQVMTACLVGTAVAVAAGAMLGTDAGMALLLLGLFVGVLGALVAGSTSRWPHLMRGTVDRSGWTVEVKAAGPFAAAFAELVRASSAPPVPYPPAAYPPPTAYPQPAGYPPLAAYPPPGTYGPYQG